MERYAMAAAALLLCGCITSEHKFPEAARDAQGAPPLIGRWVEVSQSFNRMQIEVTDLGGGRLQAVSTRVDPPSQAVYEADLYRSGNETFASIVRVDQQESGGPFYIPVKYVIENGRLVLWDLSDGAYARAEAEGRLASRVLPDGSAEVVTSSPDAILAAFAGRPAADFSVNTTFERG